MRIAILMLILLLAGCGLNGRATIYPPNQAALSQQWMMTNDPHYPWEFHPQDSSPR